jgi:hypothetical protein
MIASTSRVVTPAAARAGWAAATHMSDVARSGARRWRTRMPVRLTIHSSEVSRVDASSALVTTSGGEVDAGARDGDGEVHTTPPAKTLREGLTCWERSV